MLRATLGPLAALTEIRRLVLFNRRPFLPRGMTMADMAQEHGKVIHDGLEAPVDVVGTSTGGSIAQQLAVDHPDVVRRLGASYYRFCREGRTGRNGGDGPADTPGYAGPAATALTLVAALLASRFVVAV